MTDTDCRRCSFHLISSICWANLRRNGFAGIPESCSGSDWQHQTLTMTFFFWCRFDFEKYFGASSRSNHWAGCHQLLYTTHFFSCVTIQLRNGSLLLHRMRQDIPKRQDFWFPVSSWGTYLLIFFTFSICFKCQTTVEWSMVSSWGTSCVVVRLASMILSIGCCQLPTANHCVLHLQGSRLPAFYCIHLWRGIIYSVTYSSPGRQRLFPIHLGLCTALNTESGS